LREEHVTRPGADGASADGGILISTSLILLTIQSLNISWNHEERARDWGKRKDDRKGENDTGRERGREGERGGKRGRKGEGVMERGIEGSRASEAKMSGEDDFIKGERVERLRDRTRREVAWDISGRGLTKRT